MAYSMDLSGRVALVTGASSGLGAQFARTLSRAGAAVVLASRRVEKLKELRAQIEAEGGDAHVVALDVTSMDSIRAAVAHAETEMGAIDILINNSGVSTTQRLQDVAEADFDFIFDTNVKGAFFVAQEVGKRMLGNAQLFVLTRSVIGTLRSASLEKSPLLQSPALEDTLLELVWALIGERSASVQRR